MPPSNDEIKAALNPSFEYNPDSFQTYNEDAAIRIESDSPIVEQEGPISKHADGMYSVTTAEGKLVSI